MPEQHTAKGQKRHLYFAFDDWNHGYTIRKMPLWPGSGEGEGEGEGEGDHGYTIRKMPLWPGSGKGEGSGEGEGEIITHVCAPRGDADFFTVAFGAKILVLHPIAADVMNNGIPIIDVNDRSFTFGPMHNYPSCPIYFSVGDDRLFALDLGTFDYILRMPERGKPWVWNRLPHPPFQRIDVSSFTVQPNGCILVSTKSHTTGAKTTFIFDTNEYVWKPYGDWVFPFTGRGHYDPSLDAFVGLSKDPEKLGYLCSTKAGTGTGDNSKLHRSLDWKYSQETVYSNNPTERHVSGTLVKMHRARFCFVECVSIDGTVDQERRESGIDQELREPVDYCVWQPGVVDPVWQELWNRQEEILEPEVNISQMEYPGRVPHCGRYMYRVKAFSLRYDSNGDLKLEHCQVHCYSLPHEASVEFLKQDPAAFWL